MQHTQTVAGYSDVFDFETVTVSSTAIGLDQDKVKGNPPFTPGNTGEARGAFITSETQEIRFRFDDVPTPTVGHVMSTGSSLQLVSKWQMENIKFIRTGGSDGTLQVSFQR